MVLLIAPIFQILVLLFFVSLPSYFIWRKVLTKKFAASKYYSAILAFCVLLVSPLILFSIVLLVINIYMMDPKIPFNDSEWKIGKARNHMVDDIIKTNILMGKDTNQVKELLGAPNIYQSENGMWTYYLASKSNGFSIRTLFLDIQIQGDKVQSLNKRTLHHESLGTPE
jgi:hypothetical protein